MRIELMFFASQANDLTVSPKTPFVGASRIELE